jgi:tetratricopeptide (TPR) repeat protein
LNRTQGRFDEAFGDLVAALAIARDVGNANVECAVLRYLGAVCGSMTRFDEAKDHFEAALAVARESGDQRSEGLSLSELGLLHARQGRFGEARHCLDAGEVVLRAASDQISLGILLCSRAETEHLAGVPDAARAALAAASGIATEIGAGSDSELCLALAGVRKLCGLTESGRRPAPAPIAEG